ncbi:MAG: PilZ domain-containing protein [Bdellovibrio sp.]
MKYLLNIKGQIAQALDSWEIFEKLKSGEILWGDRVQDPISFEWSPLIEHPTFKNFFDEVHIEGPKVVRMVQDENLPSLAEWYVLREEREWGPYTFLEMVRQLQEKKISSWDLAWNASQEMWKAICELPEFSPEKIRSLRASGNPLLSDVFFLRRYVRVPYEASLVVHHNKKTHKGKSIEISAGGAAILLEEFELRPGQTLFLHFKANDGIPSFNALCAVVSKNAPLPGQKEVQYGVRFVSIMKSIQQAIEKYSGRIGDAA